jgi:hypothetical protein
VPLHERRATVARHQSWAVGAVTDLGQTRTSSMLPIVPGARTAGLRCFPTLDSNGRQMH